MDESYPPNSEKSKAPDTPKSEEPRVEQVTSAEATRRKKPLGKRISDTFFGGDVKSSINYAVLGVLVPAAKDALADAGAQAIERLIFGESKTKRRTSASDVAGRFNYNSVSRTSSPTARKQLSDRARRMHEFDELVLSDRQEADDVVDRLFDLVDRFGSATVSDLYALVGLKSSHTDRKWGWTELRGAGVTRVRNGYLLDLPEPEPLD